MEAGQIPKYQAQIAEILRKKFPENEFARLLRVTDEFITLVGKVEKPTGDIEKILSPILKHSSENLTPLATAYAGFQLGVAYEKYLNANRVKGNEK